MQKFVRHFLLATLTFLLVFTLSEALPGGTENEPKSPTRRVIEHGRHFPRNDEPLLGPDWGITTMQNNAAYVPHEEAAIALTNFYTTLRDVALHPLQPPEHWFRHRIGRLEIIFHALGIEMDWSYIVRFAERMLAFTRMGYAGSYRMVFRHRSLGLTITVVMTIGELPPEGSGCSALDEQVGVNQSGTHNRQVCWISRLH